MPRRIIKRYMPEPAKIHDHRHLRILGRLLHDPNLWHLNRKSVATAFMVGLFCAFVPIPFQMVLAALLAALLHCNLPISVALVWITNPFTMPVIFYGTYRIGAFLLDTPPMSTEFELSAEWLSGQFGEIWEPLLLGSLLTGIVVGILSNIGIRLLWRWHVNRNWNRRQLKRNGANKTTVDS